MGHSQLVWTHLRRRIGDARLSISLLPLKSPLKEPRIAANHFINAMPKIDLPVYDVLFQQWATNFADVALANASELNLSPSQTLRMQEAADHFKATYLASEEAKVIARARVGAKIAARESAEEVFRSFGAMILSNPDVGAELKGKLGMKAGRTQGPPLTPATELSASGSSNGANILKWNRNGNTDRTLFLIEALYPGESGWQFVATTTKARCIHQDQTPGVRVIYRVTSQRGDKKSLPSGLAQVYDLPLSETTTAQMAA